MLKEVVEMSKYMNASELKDLPAHHPTDFQMKCEENLTNYRAMIEHNFEKMVARGGGASSTATSVNPQNQDSAPGNPLSQKYNF